MRRSRVCTSTIEVFDTYLSTPNVLTWEIKTVLGTQRTDFLQMWLYKKFYKLLGI
jgi:hypothetical protein